MTIETSVKVSITAGGFALALFSVQPSLACHRFTHWAYPWKQPCDAAQAQPAPTPTDCEKNAANLAQIFGMGGVPMRMLKCPKGGVAPATIIRTLDIAPGVADSATGGDPRTPEQIADQAEHDAAIAAHKDELNAQMLILHVNEQLE